MRKPDGGDNGSDLGNVVLHEQEAGIDARDERHHYNGARHIQVDR
jgi:hypothetical protein